RGEVPRQVTLVAESGGKRRPGNARTRMEEKLRSRESHLLEVRVRRQPNGVAKDATEIEPAEAGNLRHARDRRDTAPALVQKSSHQSHGAMLVPTLRVVVDRQRVSFSQVGKEVGDQE